MKAILVFPLLIAFSHVALAANKTCVGMYDDAKGSQFQATITGGTLTISSAVGSPAEDMVGTHNLVSTVNGQDGNLYLAFAIESAEEGEVILVDRSLTMRGGQGMLKLRWRGEGFDESKFFCRDSQ